MNWEVNELELFPGFDFEKKHGGQNAVYQTCLERVQNHHTIFVIADGARWSSIKGLQGSYMEEFHRPRRQGSTAFKMLKKTILRSMLFLFLESTLFFSLQCFVYAVVRAQTTTAMNLVSILLSAASGFYTAACEHTRSYLLASFVSWAPTIFE